MEWICGDCIKGDPGLARAYIAEMRNKPILATIIYPGDYDWVLLDRLEFERGLHKGQNDSMEATIKALQRFGIDCLFTGSVGQFDVGWVVWVQPYDDKVQSLVSWGEEKAEMRDLWRNATEYQEGVTRYLEGEDTKLPYDPGTEMEKALQGKPSEYMSVAKDTSQGLDHTTITTKGPF